jgi:septal ring factor EnvC (AmiA/AmiB activator)
MKNDILYDKINGADHEAVVLRTLRLIEQKLEKDVAAKQDILIWQQEELKRLHKEVLDKSKTIVELNTQLIECRSQSEGNRQLINKLITDIDKLQQTVDWYKRTYESRSLIGVIKDKLKHLFR